jgi:hypothetical protein
MRMTRLILVTATTLTALLSASPSEAAPRSEALTPTTPTLPAARAQPEAPHAHQVIAFKLIGGASITRDHADQIGGPAIVYEHELWPHVLDFEFCAAMLTGPSERFYPLEVMLKHPFVLGKVVELYIGVGPSLTLHSEGSASFGAIASFGSFFWLGEHFGLLAEVDYAIVADHGAVNELEFAAGVAWRFF